MTPLTPFTAEMVSHLPVLTRIARSRLRDAAAADDLVQDTVVKALRYQDRFTAGTNMRAWLAFILRNNHLSDLRRSWRSIQMPDGLAEMQPVGANALIRCELADALEAISMLPAEQRDAVLAAAEGLSIEEMAEEFGVAEGTVKSRIARGRASLDLFFRAA